MMPDIITLSVVVPCFNEADNIPLMLKRFEKVIHRKDIEVILVDNGSTDNTAAILNKLLPQYPFARTVHRMCLVSPELQGQPEKITMYADEIRSSNLAIDAVCCKADKIGLWKDRLGNSMAEQ